MRNWREFSSRKKKRRWSCNRIWIVRPIYMMFLILTKKKMLRIMLRVLGWLVIVVFEGCREFMEENCCCCWIRFGISEILKDFWRNWTPRSLKKIWRKVWRGRLSLRINRVRKIKEFLMRNSVRLARIVGMRLKMTRRMELLKREEILREMVWLVNTNIRRNLLRERIVSIIRAVLMLK